MAGSRVRGELEEDLSGDLHAGCREGLELVKGEIVRGAGCLQRTRVNNDESRRNVHAWSLPSTLGSSVTAGFASAGAKAGVS